MKTVEDMLAELEARIKNLETALKTQAALEIVRTEWEMGVTEILKDITDTDLDIELSTHKDREMMS